MAPTVGRIVHYRLSARDLQFIETKRRASSGALNGNPHHEGQVVPAIVVWPHQDNSFNGQAFLDGNDSLWLTSILEDPDGQEPGTWFWPPMAPGGVVPGPGSPIVAEGGETVEPPAGGGGGEVKDDG